MLQDYINIMLYLTVFQCGLFSIFLLGARSSGRIGNRILAAYLLCLLLELLQTLYFRYELYVTFPHLAFMATRLIFLHGPLLLWYTRSVVLPKFAFRRRDMLHLLPFALYSILVLVAFDLRSGEEKRLLLTSKSAIIPPWLSGALLYGYYLQLGAYLFAALRRLKPYPGERAAAVESSRWLRLVLYGFLIVWSFDIAMLGLKQVYAGWQIYYAWLEALSRTYTLGYVNLFVFKGLREPALFRPLVQSEAVERYRNSPLDEPQKERIARQLEEQMQQKKLYLQPDLTLDQLARELKTLPKYLSQVINEKTGTNFFDYINGYRIEEAKRQLLLPTRPRPTVLEVLYAVGFNSKSSFNTAFKKVTGQTPTQFRDTVSVQENA